jgi:hypothetical protein
VTRTALAAAEPPDEPEWHPVIPRGVWLQVAGVWIYYERKGPPVTAPIPPDLWQRIEQLIDRRVADAYRSGALRNATISDGGNLTVTGGAVKVLSPDGATSAYWGPVAPTLPDGTYQPGWIMYREDGTLAAAMYDPNPDPGGPGDYKQFLALYDRGGSVINSDDTASGQGLARPYLAYPFYRARYADWIGTTSATFETLFRARIPKQHPRLYVRAWASNDTGGATGELRVLVNGVQVGTTQATGFVVAEQVIGPAAVAGAHMDTLVVELQARLATGTGAVRVEPSRLEGWQS